MKSKYKNIETANNPYKWNYKTYKIIKKMQKLYKMLKYNQIIEI
jgi:hypothetical protein